VGLYDWSLAAARGQVIEVMEPDPARVTRYRELLAIYTESYRALAPIYTRLAEFERTHG
jgi:hypothetical protein